MLFLETDSRYEVCTLNPLLSYLICWECQEDPFNKGYPDKWHDLASYQFNCGVTSKKLAENLGPLHFEAVFEHHGQAYLILTTKLWNHDKNHCGKYGTLLDSRNALWRRMLLSQPPMPIRLGIRKRKDVRYPDRRRNWHDYLTIEGLDGKATLGVVLADPARIIAENEWKYINWHS